MCVICSIDSVKVKKFETFKFQFNAVVNTEKAPTLSSNKCTKQYTKISNTRETKMSYRVVNLGRYDSARAGSTGRLRTIVLAKMTGLQISGLSLQKLVL